MNIVCPQACKIVLNSIEDVENQSKKSICFTCTQTCKIFISCSFFFFFHNLFCLLAVDELKCAFFDFLPFSKYFSKTFWFKSVSLGFMVGFRKGRIDLNSYFNCAPTERVRIRVRDIAHNEGYM